MFTSGVKNISVGIRQAIAKYGVAASVTNTAKKEKKNAKPEAQTGTKPKPNITPKSKTKPKTKTKTGREKPVSTAIPTEQITFSFPGN